MTDWTKAYARALGIKWSPEVAARLSQWQQWEGGSTHNSAKNNYMNTKMPMPGSWDAIGNGVQGYSTLAQGAKAFAQTINNGAYTPALKAWIATGQGDPSHDLGVWVNGPNGADAPNAKAYAAKVLGHTTTPGGVTVDKSGTRITQEGVTQPPSILGGMASVRQQAAEGFAAIAQGKSTPSDTFGPLLDTLKAAKIPQPKTAPLANGQTMEYPADSKKGQQAVNLVQRYLGIQYQWGGASPTTGFDCSGLVQYVWKTLGVNVPRTSQEQWKSGKPVTGDLKPGDEVFFVGSDGTPEAPGHEGIYIGGGEFIEAPHTGSVVRVSKLEGRSDYVGARRFA